jgi:hypothetical protein
MLADSEGSADSTGLAEASIADRVLLNNRGARERASIFWCAMMETLFEVGLQK